MKNILLFAFATAVLLCFSTCTKYETLTITQKERKGSITGFVALVDEFTKPLNEKSGVKVSLEGLPAFSTYTDTSGAFRLDSLTAGSYNLVFEKPGFLTEIRPLTYATPGGNQPTQVRDANPIYSSYYYNNGSRPGRTYHISECRTTPSSPEVVYPSVIDTTNSYNTLFTLKGTCMPNDTVPTKRRIIVYYAPNPGVTNTSNLSLSTYVHSGGLYQLAFSVSQRRYFVKGKTYYGRIYGGYPETIQRYNGTSSQYEAMPQVNPTPEFTFTPRW